MIKLRKKFGNEFKFMGVDFIESHKTAAEVLKELVVIMPPSPKAPMFLVG